MKSRDEFNQSIYEKADAYRQRRARRRSTALKTCVVVAPVAALAVVAGMLFGGTFGGMLGLTSKSASISNGLLPSDNAFPSYTQSAPASPDIVNLMAGFQASGTTGALLDGRFVLAAADFSVELFKRGVTADENSLLSPLSVLLALTMTENGAAGDTLSQMETAVGRGISADDMNIYLLRFVKSLSCTDAARVSIANSIWFRNDPSLTVQNSFLQTNADFYNAAAYKADFNAGDTVNSINQWVSDNTDGMINQIIDHIDPVNMMYLINAIAFDAQWAFLYTQGQVQTRAFHAAGGDATANFMYSEENGYIKTSDATGFIKPYAGGQYAFVALLPNKGVNINHYVQSLTGEKFLTALSNASDETVDTGMPKFSGTYSRNLNDVLIGMGMPAAFDPSLAD
ncbi:MAG: serpin family protein, partial [Oscillospiraceae bacterium]|nr:serpin family protein [Oscillospiraceae bacterium]